MSEEQSQPQQPQQNQPQQQNKRRNNQNNNSSNQQKKIQPKKDAILDLAKYIDKEVRVKFTNGRQVVGTLKGFDQLMNLVLDNVTETLRDEDNNLTKKTRQLGLVIVRGPLLLTISPVEGLEEIENPFLIEENQQPVL